MEVSTDGAWTNLAVTVRLPNRFMDTPPPSTAGAADMASSGG